MASSISQVEEIPRNDTEVPQIRLQIINLNLNEQGESLTPPVPPTDEEGLGEERRGRKRNKEEERMRRKNQQQVVKKHQLLSFDHLLNDLPLVRLQKKQNQYNQQKNPFQKSQSYENLKQRQPTPSYDTQNRYPKSLVFTNNNQNQSQQSPFSPKYNREKRNYKQSPFSNNNNQEFNLSPFSNNQEGMHYKQSPFSLYNHSRKGTRGADAKVAHGNSEESVFVFYVKGMNDLLTGDKEQIRKNITQLLNKHASSLLKKEHQLLSLKEKDGETPDSFVSEFVIHGALLALNELLDQGVFDITRLGTVQAGQVLTFTLYFRHNLAQMGRAAWQSSYAQVFRDAWMSFGCLGAMFLISSMRQ